MVDEQFDCAALSLKALSHPLRLKILCILGSGSLSVRDLADSVGSSQSNVSHHLSTLRDKGMLVSNKKAKNVYYQLRDRRMIGMIEMMHKLFCSEKPDF
ncbi:MAG: winged helix-turn-helix transcriptional regulator [Gammaproteobacteria bacterium]|nr:winged helix-turn-helix transcriptional regulator [Gammaproteobacteria bacterium]